MNIQKVNNKNKRRIVALGATTMTMLLNIKAYATSTIGQAEVETATANIKNAVVKLAMPIGSVLMFVSIVIIAIKLIVNANNPNKRSEGIRRISVGGFRIYAIKFSINCFRNST